jgi:hypothetical protein
MMRVAVWIGAAAVLLVACTPKPDPTDWQPVTLDELKPTPEFAMRTGSGGDYLTATGDFDADGKPDTARLVKDEKRGRGGVIVVLGNGKAYFTVSEFPIADLPRMGVNALRPGVYPKACVDDEMKPMTCAVQPEITFEKDALDVFAFNAHGRFIYWIGGAFNIVGISE